jgi:hypothetical protein
VASRRLFNKRLPSVCFLAIVSTYAEKPAITGAPGASRERFAGLFCPLFARFTETNANRNLIFNRHLERWRKTYRCRHGKRTVLDRFDQGLADGYWEQADVLR